MVDSYDSSIKNAMADLQRETITAKHQISNLEEFIHLKQSAIFITKVMIDQIKAAPEDSPVYARMGRGYVLAPKDTELERLQKTVEQSVADVKTLEASKLKIEIKIATAQDNMRQMIASKKKK